MLRRLDLENSESRMTHRSVWRAIVRQWWLVVLGTLISGSIAYASTNGAPPVYEAQTVVVAKPSIPTDDFGSLAETVFGTQTVLRPVYEGLTPTEQGAISHITATAVAESSGLSIVAGAADAELAAHVADEAASSFSAVATENGLGEFSIFGTAGRPGRLISPALWETVALGAFGGGLAAVTAVLVLWFIRQPILTEAEARREFPADASFSARVRTRRRRPWRWKRIDIVHPMGVGEAIWRAVDGKGKQLGQPLCCVLIGGRSVSAVAEEVKRDATVTHEPTVQIPPMVLRRPGAEKDLNGALAQASAVVALVSEGASRQALQSLDEEIRMTPDEEKRRILVFVRS